ncbi:MAG: CapA family protein [Dehalococcoidia bacterium]|jgi:poly-gamma-glutamate synthesis protein (capsule biosynthesis protein)
MAKKSLIMLAVGDVIHAHPKPEFLFARVLPVLRSADILFGQEEIPSTSRSAITCARSSFDYTPSPPCDPRGIKALQYAGFHVVSLASNHIWDSGIPGVEDTISGLRKHGIAFTGAGMTLEEARRPAIIERDGTRFGFLAYNCVGPPESWANAIKPGCAYVRILTEYELAEPCPGSPPRVFTAAEPRSLQDMIDDIRKLRPLCDVLVVNFHKGLGFRPMELAAYEQQISYAALDAGADLILGEHAHMLKGIETYKGKVIFHGLGNFIVTFKGVPADFFERLRKSTKELYGFDDDSEHPENISHPEGSLTFIAKLTIDGGSISKVSYLPCLINNEEQPEILKNDKRGQQVYDYMNKITRGIGLNTKYTWEGDEVIIHSE